MGVHGPTGGDGVSDESKLLRYRVYAGWSHIDIAAVDVAVSDCGALVFSYDGLEVSIWAPGAWTRVEMRGPWEAEDESE
jgi:hypothetical protein